MMALRGTLTMKAYDFKVLLEPHETGGYAATCPSLPGFYSQGDTIDGALDNIREAIELCLEDMQAHGEAIPDPSRVLVGSIVVTR
jgi:antitoxin HicB